MIKEKIRKIKEDKHILILTLYIFVIVLFTIFIYNTRINFHQDEMNTVGLANGEQAVLSHIDNSLITSTNQEDFSKDYINKWVEGKVVKDYLTVQNDKKFNYKRVIKNLACDVHPPLYFLVLNTIYSFIPNTFTFLPLFIINVISLIISLIYLYKSYILVIKDKTFSLIATMFYGCTISCIFTFTFLRHYAPLTALIIVFFYNFLLFHLDFGKDKTQDKKLLIKFLIISIISFLTHYYAIVIIGAITFVSCIVYLCKKQIKKTFSYGLIELASLIISFILNPNAWSILTNKEAAQKTATIKEFIDRIVLNGVSYLSTLTKNTIGITITYMTSFYLRYIVYTMLSIIILSLPILFLFRDKPFVINIKNKLSKENILRIVKNEKFKKLFTLCIIIIFSLVILIVALIYTADVVSMGSFTLRYISYICPLFLFLIFIFIYYTIIKNISNRYISLGLCLIICSLFLFLEYSNNKDNPLLVYYNSNVSTNEIRDTFSGKNVLYIGCQDTSDIMKEEDKGEESNAEIIEKNIEDISCIAIMVGVSPLYLDTTNKFFATSYDYIKTHENIKENIREENVDYILLSTKFLKLDDIEFLQLKSILQEPKYKKFSNVDEFLNNIEMNGSYVPNSDLVGLITNNDSCLTEIEKIPTLHNVIYDLIKTEDYNLVNVFITTKDIYYLIEINN